MSWSLSAAALFVFFFAVHLLLTGGRRRDGGHRRSLGFGFGVLTLVIWSFAFGDLLDDPGAGFRLALGLVLLLPAINALARPERASVLVSALCLIFGVGLAGPVMQDVWKRFNPPPTRAVLDDTRGRVESLRTQKTKLETYLERLQRDGPRLEAEIRATGHANFDAVTLDEDAMERLRELAEIRELATRARSRLSAVEERLGQIEIELRRLERHVDAEETMGSELSNEEIEAIRVKLRVDDLLREISPLETIAEHEGLRELFESGLGAGETTGEPPPDDPVLEEPDPEEPRDPAVDPRPTF